MSADDEIAAVLAKRRWAVVGCSPDPGRDSHRIAKMLKAKGYEVVPVNPSCPEIFEGPCYPRLAEIPAEAGIQVVDIFRRAEFAGAHVDEAIALGAEAVWMQLGVVDGAAAERARAAGLTVIMDRCPAIEMPRLGIGGPAGS